MPGLAGGVRLTEPVVELYKQALCKGLAGTVDAAIVEDLGVLAADANRICSAAVQVCALTLLALEGHPAECCAAWKHDQPQHIIIVFHSHGSKQLN